MHMTGGDHAGLLSTTILVQPLNAIRFGVARVCLEISLGDDNCVIATEAERVGHDYVEFG